MHAYSHKFYCHSFALQRDQRLPMGARGRMKRDLKELRRIEQICLAEAALATGPLERIGLMEVAKDCSCAADEIETQATLSGASSQLFGGGVDTQALIGPVSWACGLVGLALFVSLYLPW